MDIFEKELILITSIVEDGLGNRVIKTYKESGASGGTTFYGYGTIEDKLLNFLGFEESRKEVCMTLIDGHYEDRLYENMTKNFSLERENQGIAFSMPLKYVLGINRLKKIENVERGEKEDMKMEAIFIIVDKNKSEDVIEAGRKAGFRGGTIIHGRGSGTSENARLFNIEIEPEKDVILILSKEEETEKIVDVIKEELHIEEPGTGIIFVLDVTRSVGVYKD